MNNLGNTITLYPVNWYSKGLDVDFSSLLLLSSIRDRSGYKLPEEEFGMNFTCPTDIAIRSKTTFNEL